jgi:replicative DNA helicase
MKHTPAVDEFLRATGYLHEPDPRQSVAAPAGPDFAAIAQQQADEALALTTEDTLRCPRFPWDTLHDVVGALLPWQFWVLAAATGNGKSTTLMSLIATWLGEGRRVVMLPLEQPADIMRTYLAALRQGLDPRKVIPGKWLELPPGAKDAVQRDLRWQATPAAAELLHFSPRAFVDELGLRATMKEAADFGAEVVVIDHLHRLQMTGHRDGYHALVRICQLLKELAKEFRIPVLCAAQLNRGDGDPLAPYRPPRPSSIQGGEVIRQECDVALGVFRPLSRTLSRDEEADIRTGQKQVRDFLEPNCVGFHVLKHRLDGEQNGRVVRLRFDRGQLSDPVSEQRAAWEERNNL